MPFEMQFGLVARRRFLQGMLSPVCTAISQETKWQSLFDGKSRNGWKDTPFKGQGQVRVENAALILGAGKPLTGVNWTGTFPESNYEVRFDARRINGGDFFASLTGPVKQSFFTFVTGGWGGDIVGISSIDGWDASDNETRTYFTFEPQRWYAFRLEVTDSRIKAWIDDKPVVNVDISGRSISLRPGDIKLSTPFGFASYNTESAIRKIEYRLISR